MTFPSIRRYAPAGGSAVGADTQSRGTVSSDASTLYAMCIGSASDSGLRSYDVSTTSQIAEATVATIYGGANTIAAPYCYTPTGQLFVVGRGWPNGSAQLSLINATTFALIGTWNDTNAGGLSPSLPYALGTPQCFGATSKQSVSYVACPEAFSLGTKTVNIMQAGATGGGTCQFAGHSFAVDEYQAVSCGSPASTGKMFTIGRGPNGDDATAAGLYVTTVSNGAANYNVASWPGSPNANIATAKVGTFSPSNLGLGWTTWNSITQPGYDQDDGNLLLFAVTSDSGVATSDRTALVKINATTGAVIWATPTGLSSTNETFFAMGASEINGGVYKYNDGSRLRIFDTTNGDILSTTILDGSFLAINSTCSIDSYSTNSVITYAQWLINSPPPDPVDGITPSATPYWYRIQVGAPPAPPVPPGSAGRKFIAVLGPVRVYS